MTLVEQLNISLKDFLPERGVTIAYGKPPTVAVVSDRLHQELKRYAEANRLFLGEVIGQLHREVHDAA